MTDSNLSLYLHGKCDLRLGEKPIQEPGPGQVQLSMRRVGICGSDVHLWQTGRIGPFILREGDDPVVLGHEGSGVVTKLGAGVTSLKVGDRVAVEPATTCRLCHYCKGGRYNLCPRVQGLALPGIDGHLSRSFVMAEDFCHKLPDNVSFEEGAAAEPLSVAVHSTTRANIKMGDTILICGAGPIGVLVMLVCKARGIKSVCLTDIDDSRLAFAKKLGANHVINARGKEPQTVADEVETILGEQPHVAMECSGTQHGVSTALKAARPGGRMMAVGMSGKEMSVPLSDIIVKEVDIITSFRYMNSFPTAIELMSTGQVDIKPLLSHHFKLEDAVKAFETAHAGLGVKIVIDCEKK